MTGIQYKLGDICDFQGGSQPPKSNFIQEPKEGYIRLLQIRDFKSDDKAVYIPNVKKNRICESDDIMIGRYGASVGQIHRGKAGAYNVALIKAIPNTDIINKDYLYLYLQSELFQKELASVSARSAQAGFSKADISPFDIVIPPIPEQKRIVSILDTVFADLEQARAKTEQNLKNARDLFDSYLEQVFSQRGEGWEDSTLANICKIKPPKSEAREKLTDEDNISFVPMNCLGINRIDLDVHQSRKFSEVSGSYTYFAENDVLLAKITPCFENGKLGLASNLINGIGFGSSEFIVFRCREGLNPKFLYYFLSRKKFLDEGKARMTGAVGHKRVAKEFIENYIIGYPPAKKQIEIIEKLDVLKRQILNLEDIYVHKITLLEELKKSILQKAFSGELTAKAE